MLAVSRLGMIISRASWFMALELTVVRRPTKILRAKIIFIIQERLLFLRIMMAMAKKKLRKQNLKIKEMERVRMKMRTIIKKMLRRIRDCTL